MKKDKDGGVLEQIAAIAEEAQLGLGERWASRVERLARDAIANTGGSVAVADGHPMELSDGAPCDCDVCIAKRAKMFGPAKRFVGCRDRGEGPCCLSAGHPGYCLATLPIPKGHPLAPAQPAEEK